MTKSAMSCSEMIEILEAIRDGNPVELRCCTTHGVNKWYECTYPHLPNFREFEYRVKPSIPELHGSERTDYEVMVSILAAIRDGKKLQLKSRTVTDSDWLDRANVYSPPNFQGFEYRVKPEPLEVYMNVYEKGEDGFRLGFGCETLDAAKKQLNPALKGGRTVKFKEVVG